METLFEDRLAVGLRRCGRQAWRVFDPGQRRILLAVAATAAMLLLGAAFLRVMPVMELVDGFGRRRAERNGLAGFIAQAKREPVDYDAARADPGAFKGRPVVWCVDHPAAGVSYLSGRPSQPLAWSDEVRLPKNSPTTGGRCDLVVATIEGASREGLVLNFVGRP